MQMPDLETLITQTIERAVQTAVGKALIDNPRTGTPSSSSTDRDDEVLGVPALAQYLGIGERLAYRLVNANPAHFPVKRVGQRLLVLKGHVRHWLEAGGQATISAMPAETRKLLEARK
jgi:predicted DNA-binding transcriptional regulator AlpA